jgi:hypothetical protein
MQGLRFEVSGWSAPWFFLCACIFGFSWLNTYVYLPWTDFAKDAYIGFCFLVIGGIGFWKLSNHALSLTYPVLACLGLAFAVAVQFAFGYFSYGEHAVWAIAALVGCAFVSLLSTHIRSMNFGKSLAALISTAVILAALVHLGVAVAQRFRLMPYDDINFPGLFMLQARYPMRPGGNFGQPNLLATFMIWALLASAWMESKKHIGRTCLALLSCLFCFGNALTQSRVGALSMAIVVLLSWYVSRSVGKKFPLRIWTIACFLSYLFFSAALAAHAYLSDADGLRRILFSDSIREIIYSSYFQASLMKPWLGWGMTHLVEVQWTVWPIGLGNGVLYLHAHNILLDLALWVGWPITLILLFGLGWCAWRRLNQIEDAASWCAFTTVAVLFVHACFELPHMLAYFFLPAAWWVGLLSSPLKSANHDNGYLRLFANLKLRGVWCVAVTICAGIYLALFVWEYQRVEPEFWRIRLEHAKIGKPQTPTLPPTLLLTPLADRIRLQAIRCEPDMSQTVTAQLARNTRAFPSLHSIYLTACSFALSGQPNEAQIWMLRMNRIASPEQVAHFAREWEIQRKLFPTVSTKPWLALH